MGGRYSHLDNVTSASRQRLHHCTETTMRDTHTPVSSPLLPVARALLVPLSLRRGVRWGWNYQDNFCTPCYFIKVLRLWKMWCDKRTEGLLLFLSCQFIWGLPELGILCFSWLNTGWDTAYSWRSFISIHSERLKSLAVHQYWAQKHTTPDKKTQCFI